MPRCGSTLVESIISLNSQVDDLGEVNTFENATVMFILIKKKLLQNLQKKITKQ